MKTVFLILLASCLSLSANAALISNDDARFGAGSITTDTASGLEWLDLGFSTGLSYNQISAQTGSGGLFDGFRLALLDEVRRLFVAAGLPGVSSVTADFASVNALIDLVGATSSQAGFLESLGVTGTATGSGGSHFRAGLDFTFSNGLPRYRVDLGGGTQGDTASFDSFGGWLVRAAVAVPEPVLAALLLIGIPGLLVARRGARRAVA